MKKIVREGTFLYGKIVCNVKIIQTNVRLGTGDPYDSKEIREDKKGKFYYVNYESPLRENKFTSRTFCLNTLKEAIEVAEKSAKIKWKND